MQSDQHQLEWVIEPVGRDGTPLNWIPELDLGIFQAAENPDSTKLPAPLPIIEW